MIDPFVTFEKYISIKLTYDVNTDYEYFTYGGKTRQKKETFLRRKDKYHFYALAKNLHDSERDIEAYLFVNMLHNPKYWIGDLLSEECKSRFAKFKKYENSFNYVFKEELKKLSDYIDNESTEFNDLFRAKNHLPRLMELMFAEVFTPMLGHGFNRAFGIYSHWSAHEQSFEPLLVEPMKRLMYFENFARKYSHGLTKDAIHDTIREIFGKE